VPRQPLDARHDLPEQNPCQAAFGKLQDEVSGMPNEAATGLEEPLPETRQRPALDGQRQGVVADREVVGDDPEQQAGLIGPEPVTGSTLAIARRGRFQEAAWYWKLR